MPTIDKGKIYISGKIAGLPVHEARKNFADAATSLAVVDYTPVNPFDVMPKCGNTCNRNNDDPSDDPHAWECYLKYDIIAMLQCRGVALLPNWTTSKGALLELYVARQCGLEVRPLDMWSTWVSMGATG